MTHKELMAKQAKNLKLGEELLARGKELLAEGRKILEGGKNGKPSTS